MVETAAAPVRYFGEWLGEYPQQKDAPVGRAEAPCLLEQIDAHRFGFARLWIYANLEGDGIALGDRIALAQRRYVEENIVATIVRFDETEALILVEHLNFAGWHGLSFFLSCEL
jgi:hypothetical protein